MDVTSNHLEVVPHEDQGMEEAGEEQVKRIEKFGSPVGKSACVLPSFVVLKLRNEIRRARR